MSAVDRAVPFRGLFAALAVFAVTACQGPGPDADRQAAAAPDSAVACDSGENLLRNPAFLPAEGERRAPWRGAQHAGEPSFDVSASDGVLTIERVATQPWYTYAQFPPARALRGRELLFRADLQLDLDSEGWSQGLEAGGGLQVLIWGLVDPVMGGSRLVYRSSLEQEPRLGNTDWFTAELRFAVPENATRMSVGFLHQANGSFSIRDPALLDCGPVGQRDGR